MPVAPTLLIIFLSIIRENKPSFSRSSFFQCVSSSNHFPHRSTITNPNLDQVQISRRLPIQLKASTIMC
ncbi:hypothetical protein LR48_Vigan529s000200 [Vigna angularis]|uniref:Uncharacterized protein n=1 Tax=Phaseolus angularis TaxID=3914 RepID=A0A0L9TCU5_PHAAN|nr:hypothetical protein LR48_Vigan529s000200 [Vigna angularis]